jgi:hypothetical protein
VRLEGLGQFKIQALPIHIHSVVLTYLSTGKDVPLKCTIKGTTTEVRKGEIGAPWNICGYQACLLKSGFELS